MDKLMDMVRGLNLPAVIGVIGLVLAACALALIFFLLALNWVALSSLPVSVKVLWCAIALIPFAGPIACFVMVRRRARRRQARRQALYEASEQAGAQANAQASQLAGQPSGAQAHFRQLDNTPQPWAGAYAVASRAA
ncbi:hypothetical protein [Actinobaculum suis]|uniref:Cardiolipin synthase N-terminal domain-containing protein n=2 Tax=Actinobaculum suis TaxID=1657 RepID=A0AAW9HLY8_9ACTO|nr:hypothetical protein [Actinobaculum suis]MDY5152499.1 hypothetical protein [Actinobaculum suis]